MAQINKPSEYFNTKLWTGTGAENAITGVGFQPDWVWIKNRDAAEHNKLYDAVRGATKNIYSNLANAEGTDAQSLKSFDSDGFTLGTESALNASGQDIVGWSWKANGSGVSNTDGDITSTVSANTTSGFSIVSYTGNGSAGATVGHGLGVTPKMVIVKRRDGAVNWIVYHTGIGATKYIQLNEDGAETLQSSYNMFNSTAPSSSLITLGNLSNTNGNTNTYISYCFAEKKGFSKFGSYVGNGAGDGTFVYTGFKPAFVMVKNTDAVRNWTILDNKRDVFNSCSIRLFPNSNEVEAGTVGSEAQADILSNGFKTRTNDANFNASGNNYIYMAFAENPLVGTNNIPATAR